MAQTCLWIVLLPLTAFVIQALFGKKLPRHGDWVSVLAILGSFSLAAPIFMSLLKNGTVMDQLSYTWISLPFMGGVADAAASVPVRTSYDLVIGTLVNPLTAIMLFMVTLCASLIHIFSTGYMHGEDRYHLFFAYISLFSAGMLGLVVSNNLFTFFVCWELMGLCSYLLIGFYYKKPSAMNASIKAFLTTRVGDVCFFMGICGLYYIFGTTVFTEIYASIDKFQGATILGVPALAFIGFMILMGTIGKSAQFPLQVWLPDAMEGPTPVSALIHAATMVAAGVFLLVRMFPLLDASHVVLPVVAYVGGITAFLAALLAIVQIDIKKVLAYSTISQLGFMVMGVGVGDVAAGFMHVLTHACFKACLFMSSGSVIHAVHTQDMREMGGLRTKMPWTFTAMLIATLAISGVPFFSGFVSKDRILGSVLAYSMEHQSHWLLPVLGFTTAAITAFYMFRLIYLTFFGHARDEHKHHHAHEAPFSMVFPVVLLAVLSLSIFWSGPTGIHAFDQVLPIHWFDTAFAAASQQMGIHGHHGNPEIHHTAHHLGLIISLCCAALGILVSSLTYLKKVFNPAKVQSLLAPVHKVLWNKYYFDDLYLKGLIQGLVLPWNQFLAKFDDVVVDGIFVDGWAKVAMVIKSVVAKFDDIVVDRLFVDGTGNVIAVGGWVLRRFQTGRVQQYLILVILVLGFWLLYLSKFAAAH